MSKRAINVLLGNMEEEVNDLIEEYLQKIFADQADIKCARVSSLDEFVEQGCTGPFDLCLLIPNNVLGFKRRTFGTGALEESVHAIRTVRSFRPACVIALDVFPEYAPVLLDAGADFYLDFVDFDGLKSAAARCLNLPLAA
jgi:hypothetical protein